MTREQQRDGIVTQFRRTCQALFADHRTLIQHPAALDRRQPHQGLSILSNQPLRISLQRFVVYVGEQRFVISEARNCSTRFLAAGEVRQKRRRAPV